MTTMTYGQLVEAYVAVRDERDQLRDNLARLQSQLAEVRQERDQAAEALVRAETERDEALCAITKIAEVLGFPGGDLREAIRALRRERDDALQEAESVGRQLHGSTREVDRLIAQLATVTQERDEAWEAQAQHATAMAAIEIIDDLRAALGLSPGQPLTKAVTQLRDDLAWLRRQVLTVAEDLERYASDPRPEKLPVSERKLAWTLRQIVAEDRPEAPETAPESPQTGEQTGVRVETGTETAMPEPELMTYGELAEAYRRARAEIDTLRARVREWEAVNADLAARCDSGDIPIRLGERYSLAVLREIDRLRTERDRLRRRLGDVLDLEELPEGHTIVAAVRRLRAALGTTPDTGSTDG